MANYSGQVLSGQDFSNRVLIGVDFSNCTCDDCDFSGSDLSFADFTNTSLYRSNFSNSILYVTYFRDADLTRANFDNSFIYGAKFIGNVNVTYCSFKGLRLENERRLTVTPSDKTAFQEVKELESTVKIYGAKHQSNDSTYREKYGSKFFCNGAYMEFHGYKPYEREMQFSQIYNRLKRVYRENNFSSEAGQFYFLEKYWRTRSWFTTGTKEDFAFGAVFFRVANTVFARLNEFVCGYGEKPLRVIWGMVIGTFIFTTLFYLGSFKEVTATTSSWDKLIESFYHSICVILMIDSTLTPIGLNRVLTIIETVYGLIMITLFTSILIRKMIRD